MVFEKNGILKDASGKMRISQEAYIINDRTDSTLLKHLAKTISVEAAKTYNALPLFVMPDESDELLRYEKNLIEASPDNLVLPFDDFLLDFPFGIEPLLKTFAGGQDVNVRYRGRMWVRIRHFNALKIGDPATTIRDDQIIPLIDSTPDGIFLEAWEEKTGWGGLPPYPDYSAINIAREYLWNFTTYLHVYPRPECPEGQRAVAPNLGWCNIAKCIHPERKPLCAASELVQSTSCRLAILATIYITEGLGGSLAEISWFPKAGTKDEKTERLKPWLSQRRRTYIIIDPARAGAYGHPSSKKPDTTGHHASPVPHSRRGHWRRLSADRRTWVKPAWVGVTNWQHEGRTYKIVLNKEGVRSPVE